MLPGEQLLPREILSYHGNIVNQVFDFVCTEANNYRADRFKRIVQVLQLWLPETGEGLHCTQVVRRSISAASPTPEAPSPITRRF